MWRALLRYAVLALPLAVSSSDGSPFLEAVVARSIQIKATALKSPAITLSKRLRYVAGWQLESEDAEFGGLSALVFTPGGLVALADKGVLLRFERAEPPRTAGILPLPRGCAFSQLKLDRDSESIARDPASGAYWIGFEWRNAICRADRDLTRAVAVAQPAQMRSWPRTGGPEAMTRLADGRTIAIAERGTGGGRDSPMLIYAGDPSAPGARATVRRYIPPKGYRPTDIAELPDGSLLVLHRRFRLPFDFAAMLTMLPPGALDTNKVESGRPLALFKSPGLSDNFEGVTVQAQGERVYILMVSDDNFVPSQKTYLLKFELLGGSSGVR